MSDDKYAIAFGVAIFFKPYYILMPPKNLEDSLLWFFFSVSVSPRGHPQRPFKHLTHERPT